MILTYKYRIKDATSRKRLERHARAVNFVWNYCCEIQRKAEGKWRAGSSSARWPTHFTLIKLTTGVGAELGIGSEAIGAVCRQFATTRDIARHAPRFRASGGSRRALGWVPFPARFVKVGNGVVTWYGQKFRFWQSREIGSQIKTGAFVQDARGRWYVTFHCEVAGDRATGAGCVGIDLGLKTLATLSTGETVPALQHYRQYETALATAQRAGNRRRAKSIHAKIANVRRDQMHKATTKIARENNLIVIGNVSSSKLAKTRMAKSVMDASWAMFKSQIEYKARRHRSDFIIVDEAFTSQVCSECGSLPTSRPRGIADLRIRCWECSDCGTLHDRDVNAARNILRIGAERRPPAAGISRTRDDVNKSSREAAVA